ncbi:RNA-directed DNA polymerase from mobile element jockey [Collichthys lucidus]|uniref:RNA-directed DNA polymerase from mobile element jockey n=1 Tax=Collichthys lucidus TaxID=240159 RepID=A0A4V6ALX8_COLLU|nr:RNA-directed DNA polymerase from mobile element jockey [Collichthys lucidus]
MGDVITPPIWVPSPNPVWVVRDLKRVQSHQYRLDILKGKDSYRRKLEERLEQNNARDVWRGLQTIAGHGKGVGRNPVSGDKDWADELNLFFNRFDSAPPPSLTPPDPYSHLPWRAPPPPAPPLLSPTPFTPSTPNRHPLTSSQLNTPTPPPQSSSSPLSITDDHVRSQLKKIKARKAPGPDGISPRLLKDCADQLCGVVRRLFNLSLSLEKVPALWKTSCVVPVPKTPRPKEPNHFRPVALTSHLMKTMERIILRHLRLLVGTQLDPLQFAYQPGIGVEDAVIYLLHRSLLHLEDSRSAVRVMFFYFSSAFNTIQPSLLRVKMERVGVDQHLAAWTTDYLTNRPQFVKLQHCVSDVVLCSTGAPQGTVLSPFLFTLYTSDFTHNTAHCHIQKFSDDTAVVGRVSEGDDLEYRTIIRDFVSWCELNQLQLNTSKTKEMIVNYQRKTSHFTPVNIQGSDIEVVRSYRFLGVHLNNKLDWTDNTHALYKKGQSRLHLLRRLRSFGVCRALLRTFYDSVVASAIFYAVVCWRGSSTDRDRSRLNRLIRRASSVLDCPLDSTEEVGERRMLAKLTSIMDNPSHPLHDTVGSLSSSFSSRLIHPWCKKERFRRSFIPAAVRLYNTCT